MVTNDKITDITDIIPLESSNNEDIGGGSGGGNSKKVNISPGIHYDDGGQAWYTDYDGTSYPLEETPFGPSFPMIQGYPPAIQGLPQGGSIFLRPALLPGY